MTQTQLHSGPRHLELWSERLDDPCFVYIVRQAASDLIKIGKAKDVRRRLSQLQVGNPSKLELLYVVPTDSPHTAILLEASLHRRADPGAVRGEWFSGASTELVLLLIDGLTQRMVEIYDGYGNPPNVWSVLPPPARDPHDAVGWHEVQPGVWHPNDEIALAALYQQYCEITEAVDSEEGIAPLGESQWPRIAHLFMEGEPLEAIALEFDVTLGRLERTMDAMRKGGYALDPRMRRVRDWGYGSESNRRWVRAS